MTGYSYPSKPQTCWRGTFDASLNIPMRTGKMCSTSSILLAFGYVRLARIRFVRSSKHSNGLTPLPSKPRYHRSMTERQTFDAAMKKVLSVSKQELQRRIEREKEQ